MGKTSVCKIQVDVATATKLKNAMKALPEMVKQEIGKAVVKIVLIIEQEAKKRCPVDTGLLRSSITPVVESWAAAHVGTNTEYAPYVEYGTKHTPAQPFFEPAFLEGSKRAPAIFEKAFARAIARFDAAVGK